MNVFEFMGYLFMGALVIGTIVVTVGDIISRIKQYTREKKAQLPRTNGDRIRKMMDAEIAELFTGFEYDGIPRFICPVGKIGDGKCPPTTNGYRDCRECFLQWLKEEVKSDGL